MLCFSVVFQCCVLMLYVNVVVCCRVLGLCFNGVFEVLCFSNVV